MSAVSKLFYYLSRNNAGSVKKLSHSRILFAGFNIQERYKDACLSFASQLSHVFNKDFEKNFLLNVKGMIMDSVFLVFCRFVSGIICCCFFCSGSYHYPDMSLICTRVHISHRAASDYINKNSLFQLLSSVC